MLYEDHYGTFLGLQLIKNIEHRLACVKLQTKRVATSPLVLDKPVARRVVDKCCHDWHSSGVKAWAVGLY